MSVMCYEGRSCDAMNFLWFQCKNTEIINPEYGGFGKNLLKSYKLHPDTFVQVCLQYGYYKMHGK